MFQEVVLVVVCSMDEANGGLVAEVHPGEYSPPLVKVQLSSRTSTVPRASSQEDSRCSREWI